MKKILIFVHTEYHLLLAVNQILSLYSNKTYFEVELYIRKGRNSKRLSQELDFSDLPFSYNYFSEEVTIDKTLGIMAREAINILVQKKPDIFIFFQEQDPLMIILCTLLAKKGTEIHLCQDGLKPYVNLKFHSLGLIKNAITTNIWLKHNGFDSLGWMYPIISKKYAYLKGISKVFLSFPESYKNWNYKTIEKIEVISNLKFNNILKKLFLWKEEDMPERENIIFYMNQPMHDDGSAETNFLIQLNNKFPENTIYIKLHPLTHNLKKTSLYESIPNIKIIYSLIPAELFIMNLRNSIILSVNSTSMFIDNPECRFYYLNRIFEKQIKRLNRNRLSKPPSKHIVEAQDLNDINF